MNKPKPKPKPSSEPESEVRERTDPQLRYGCLISKTRAMLDNWGLSDEKRAIALGVAAALERAIVLDHLDHDGDASGLRVPELWSRLGGIVNSTKDDLRAMALTEVALALRSGSTKRLRRRLTLANKAFDSLSERQIETELEGARYNSKGGRGNRAVVGVLARLAELCGAGPEWTSECLHSVAKRARDKAKRRAKL